MKLSIAVSLTIGPLGGIHALTPVHRQRTALSPLTRTANSVTTRIFMSEEEEPENPYADPNYPDLEFVNYDDPEYRVDQGEELFDADSTEEQIEAMREDRRMRNDEFQFETYFKDILKEGKEEYMGEWTVMQTSTFLQGHTPGKIPGLKKVPQPLKVISKGERIEIDVDNSENRLANQRLLHKERLSSEGTEEIDKQIAKASMSTTYWPDETSSFDFRGQQGIMCVGNGYSICKATQIKEDKKNPHLGPFSDYRAELGIQDESLRFRVKLDYAILEQDMKVEFPQLHLRTLTICRETLGAWPRVEAYKSKMEGLSNEVLFGRPGALGGLYDPPPVGTEEQAAQYFLLDLEGGATLLLPFCMDQDPEAHDGSGWVTSLDWSPGKFRFQLDRKVGSGGNIRKLTCVLYHFHPCTPC